MSDLTWLQEGQVWRAQGGLEWFIGQKFNSEKWILQLFIAIIKDDLDSLEEGQAIAQAMQNALDGEDADLEFEVEDLTEQNRLLTLRVMELQAQNADLLGFIHDE
jgi:hypothetical protein